MARRFIGRAYFRRSIFVALLSCICAVGLSSLPACSNGPELTDGRVGAMMAVPAASIDASHFELLEWRFIGPSRGGRSVAVSGDPSNKLVAYFGGSGSGVWKTVNGGVSWRNVSDGFFRTASVGAIAVAPSSPNVIYVGMGESCFRGNAMSGDGVYKSTDGGETWTHLGLEATRQISGISVHPQNPDLVYVAAFGDGFGPNAERGVFRSKDGGQTWQRILYRDDRSGAIDFVMNPANPRLMYATLLEFQRFPWGLRSAGPGTGLFKSVDGGDTWTELTNNPGLPAGLKGRIGVALSPANPNRVWAIIDAETGKKGLFRSDDAGATWRRISDFAQLTVRPWYYHHVFADPKNADIVYVLNIQMWKSTDAGTTWTEIRPPHGDNHDLWIDQADPSHLVQANDGGGTVSYDGGLSWSTTLNQPTAQIYHVTTDNQFPYRVYGAQQDNSTISIPTRSDFGMITPSEWLAVGGGEAGYIAVNQADPNIIVAGEHHMLERYDLRTRQNREISPWPESNWGWGDGDMKYRFQWTYPVVRSPHDQNVLYVTSQFVHKTTDEGQSWTTISPDLTRHEPSRLEPMPSYGNEQPGQYWGPITRDNTGVEWYSTIFAFAESPIKKDVLWAGSDDGYVQVSRDGGKAWTNVTPKELPEFSLVSIIDPSPHDAGTAYVAANRYKLQDREPYLFKTTDYGQTWTKITSGIPEGHFARVIRADPGRAGILYAGTEGGVYVSLDDGGSWQPLQLNLPVTAVHDLAVKNGDLVAATHGRSFWVLDNVALLHQFEAATLQQPVTLFKPRATTRFRGNAAVAARGDSERNSDGRNPPNGVVVQWFTKEKPSGEVTLTFLDAGGNEIRRFSSNEPPPMWTPRGGRAGSVRVPLEAGANRFVWDMRYPLADIIPGTTLRGQPNSPLVIPGSYAVNLTINGQTLTQTFDVVKDPRISATDRELVEQRDFLLAVRDKLTETHDAVRKIRSAREEAEAALEAGNSSADALEALNDKLYPIEERLTQFRAKDMQDLTNYGNALDDKLANLLGVTGRADAPPTDQAREVLTDLTGRFDELIAAMNQALARETTGAAGGSK